MNNLPESQSVWQRSQVARACKWLCSWRGIRRVLIVLAWIATMIVLLYAEENWRGRRMWNNYCRQLPRGGAELIFGSYLPKPVPDDQNLAGTPFIKQWMIPPSQNPTNYWPDTFGRANNMIPDSRKKKERQERHLVDLAAWKEAFARVQRGEETDKVGAGLTDAASRAAAASAILDALRVDDAIFAELKAASKRPYALYPVNYDVEMPFAILLPHLANIRGATQRLQLKACAELALGQADAALEDIELILRLAEPVKQEPLLISQLVRVAAFNTATGPVWEGIVEHRWSEPNLERLRQAFAPVGFFSEAQFSFKGERAAGVATVDFIRQKGMISNLAGPDSIAFSHAVDLLVSAMPRGWFRMEQVNLCKAGDIVLEGGLDVNTRRVWPGRLQANAKELERWLGVPHRSTLGKWWHHQLIASLMLASGEKVMQKLSAAQVTADEAVIACVLEEYRLNHGAYPENLEALDSKLISQLPKDVISGQAYKYKRNGAGYLVYSVGWNEKDDGGVPGETVTGSNEGDWVWECPAGPGIAGR